MRLNHSTAAPFKVFKNLAQDALTACIQYCNQRILVDGGNTKQIIHEAYHLLKAATRFQESVYKLQDYPLWGGVMREKRRTISKKEFIYLLDQDIIDMLYNEDGIPNL